LEKEQNFFVKHHLQIHHQLLLYMSLGVPLPPPPPPPVIVIVEKKNLFLKLPLTGKLTVAPAPPAPITIG
jgi:hypothetical protein